MGTCNFNSNSSIIYTIDNSENEFIFEDIMSNIQYEFIAIDKDKNNILEFIKTDNDIGEIYIDFNFMGLNFNIIYKLLLKSGYYSGMNLDYEVSYNYDYNSNFDKFEDIINDIIDYNEVDYIGLFIANKSKLEKKFNYFNKILLDKINEIFSIHCDNKLSVSGRFSDGTCLYNEVV